MGFQSFDTAVKELLNPKRGKKIASALYCSASIGKMIFKKPILSPENNVDLPQLN